MKLPLEIISISLKIIHNQNKRNQLLPPYLLVERQK